MRRILILFSFLLLQSTSFLRADEVDAFVQQQMQKQRIPGLALLVVKDGQTLKSKGYGIANLEHQVPVKPETIFQSGSVGKQFTAAAVMMLVEEGKLALEDPIGKHLTVPEGWRGITIRHLLTHTSGTGDYPQDMDYRKDYTEDELLQMVTSQPLQFKPGEQWSYSNLGYITLGILIHKISGKFYGDFLQERVFRPLGMSATRIINEADIIPNRAAGYQIVKEEIKNQDWVAPILNTTADGALYFNIEDLAKWDAALYTEKLLKKSSLDEIWAPVTLGDGSAYPYGFGWVVGEYNGHRRIEHGGGWQGFATHIARYVDDRLTVVALTNLAQANPSYFTHGVAGFYVPALALAKHSPIKIDPKLLQLYAGKYQMTSGPVMEVAAGDNKLMVKLGPTPREFFPESNDSFYREDSENVLRFATDASGQVTHLILNSGGLPLKLERIP
jgi:CubicO group peptidase (beta-lactamase class C family)